MKQNNLTLSDEKIYDIISAPFVRRLIAWIVDQFIVGGLAALLFYLTYGAPQLKTLLPVSEEILSTLLLLSLAYFTILEGTTGQTAGKKLLKIRVLAETGEEVSYSSALLRRIGPVIPYLNIADGVAILLTSKNQRIFDVAAGTLVIRENFQRESVKFLRRGDITQDLVEKDVLVKAPKNERNTAEGRNTPK